MDPPLFVVKSSSVTSCKGNPRSDEAIRTLIERFKSSIRLALGATGKEFSDKQFETVVKQFYKLMDSVRTKVTTNHPMFDSNFHSNQEMYFTTLFACSFEIVEFLSFGMQVYPWIANSLKVPHFYIFKMLQLVRTDASLSKDVIKHLNTIEESILDCLAWKKESPLWNEIMHSGQGIPRQEDIIPDYDATKSVVKLIAKQGSTLDKYFIHSRSCNAKQVPNHSLNEFESIVKNTKAICNGQDSLAGNVTDPVILEKKSKSLRTDPIAIFFQKFYRFASVRITDLCNQLKLTVADVRKKIWICFEKTMVKHISLMFDHHLDQLIMCNIYVICKITGNEVEFSELLKYYRFRSEGLLDTYRDLLKSTDFSVHNSNLEVLINIEKKEKRLDIIQFYNSVYITRVKSLVKEFICTNSDVNILSPIPQISTSKNTKRITERHRLYLHRFGLKEIGESSQSDSSQSSFVLRGSGEEFGENSAISKPEELHPSGIKRELSDDDDDDEEEIEICSSVLAKKIKKLCHDRAAAASGSQDQ